MFMHNAFKNKKDIDGLFEKQAGAFDNCVVVYLQ